MEMHSIRRLYLVMRPNNGRRTLRAILLLAALAIPFAASLFAGRFGKTVPQRFPLWSSPHLGSPLMEITVALGDPTGTDDSRLAIQNAIDTVGASGGGFVRFPPRSTHPWKFCNLGVPSNVALKGEPVLIQGPRGRARRAGATYQDLPLSGAIGHPQDRRCSRIPAGLPPIPLASRARACRAARPPPPAPRLPRVHCRILGCVSSQPAHCGKGSTP
jgi:hypothetical protein